MLRALREYVPNVPGITSPARPETTQPAEDIVLLRVKDSLRNLSTLLSFVWVSGAVGGFVFFLIGPLFEYLRIFEATKTDLHYELNWSTLFATVTWGAAWGLIFMLALPRQLYQGHGQSKFWLRALLYGHLPALVEIFLVQPHEGHGIGGVQLGAVTPAFILLFNTLFWALPAYAWLHLIGPDHNNHGAPGYEALLGREEGVTSSA